MKRYESEIKFVAWPQENVYNRLSDLSNLQTLAGAIPQSESEKISIRNLQATRDQVSCEISPLGRLALGIVSREPSKCIKFETLQSPIRMTMWIQILPTGPENCKFKITVDADLNVFMAKMVEKPLTQAIGKIADLLSNIPYNE